MHGLCRQKTSKEVQPGDMVELTHPFELRMPNCVFTLSKGALGEAQVECTCILANGNKRPGIVVNLWEGDSEIIQVVIPTQILAVVDLSG